MRYYKATNGQITVFRSTNRTYRSASFTTQPSGQVSSIGFSAVSGQYPAIEISRQKYLQLQQLKADRCQTENARADHPGASWVRNSDIPASEETPTTPRGWDKVET
jgi:hypothetical protein